MLVLINLLVTVGMLVVVPVGLGLPADPAAKAARRCWSYGAAAGAVSLWLPRGVPAAVLATIYAAAERVGCRLFGFELNGLTLTVAHFRTPHPC